MLEPAAHLASLTEVGTSATARPLLRGNRITPLYNGDEAYPAMIEAEDWAFTTGDLLQGQRWFPPPKPAGSALARGISGGPDDMAFPLINRARAVFYLVTGDEKATALAQVLEGPADAARFPSQRVRPTGGRLD